jgi:SAM-dependent methyltransferase
VVERRASEIVQGATIAPQAEAVWGWTTPAGRLRWQRRVAFLTAGISKGECVLELGCGTGLLTETLIKTGACVTAIDISDDLLKIARGRVSSNTLYICRDIETLSRNIGTFDAVIGSSILHHVNLDKVLGGIFEVLRPGGFIRFAEPNMMNPQIFLQKNIPLFKRWAQDTPHETAFFRWGLRRRLERCGFTDVTVKNFDFLHPAVPERWIKAVDRMGRVWETVALLREISGSLIIEAKRGGVYAAR